MQKLSFLCPLPCLHPSPPRQLGSCCCWSLLLGGGTTGLQPVVFCVKSSAQGSSHYPRDWVVPSPQMTQSVSDSVQTLCGYSWYSSPGGSRPQACLYPWNRGIFLLFYEPQERGGEVPIISMKSLRHREVRKPSYEHTARQRQLSLFFQFFFFFVFPALLKYDWQIKL